MWLIFMIPAVYALGILAVYMFEDSLIFQTAHLSKDHDFIFDQPFQEFFIPTSDGEQLNNLLFKTEQPARGLIVYFHGNAGNLQGWGTLANDFTRLGYDLLITDYRGYGKSTGTPSETALYDDAETVWNWARSNYSYDKWIIYGRSLGSAVASKLAVTANHDLLILETPFDEIKSLFPANLFKWAIKNKFSNLESVPQVKTRIIIFQGTDDNVVPLSSANRIKPLLKETDQMYIIEGGGHNDLREFAAYHEKLAEVLP